MKLNIDPKLLFDPDLLRETTDLLLGEIEDAQVIPKDQGSLENHHEVHHPEEKRAEIVASTPYARRLYMHPEYDFRNGENANAKGAWFEDWEPNGKYEGRVAEIYTALWNKKYGGGT